MRSSIAELMRCESGGVAARLGEYTTPCPGRLRGWAGKRCKSRPKCVQNSGQIAANGVRELGLSDDVTLE